eukprot:gnl/TRDRNA2_/TRDRNA2_199120_c0_seq1.p1 gnl/TRDRNA2_/TRDRNA2_199120_c0~~gnl/TRDRNA2_/TRDRNA2_199120_c0_seq1.p1  ORF type:complete len:302 (-),score=49.54 gnl/TRDRNA2_/TRDRNA2_199120_c0_seq1:78-938(-)
MVAVPATVSFPFDVAALLQRCADHERIELPMGGIVLRDVLDECEQRWLYEQLLNMADKTEVFDKLVHSDADDAVVRAIPAPLAYWNHPYSNANSFAGDEPTQQLLRWAQELLCALAPEASGVTVDSMLAQVYFQGGRLQPHVDQDLSWGLGLSLGAPSLFNISATPPASVGQSVPLNSGDIVVGEFGQMKHSVKVLANSMAPAWWRQVPNLGRARCNVLFRHALSEKDLRRFSEPRAQKLYDRSLDQLLKESELSLGACAMALRHAEAEPKESLPPAAELGTFGAR